MVTIYSVTNKIDGRRYIGKTTNPKSRWWQHKWMTKQESRFKGCNRHLFNAVKRHGIENFKFEILETFNRTNEKKWANAEIEWMEHYKTCDRKHGYNLRKDSGLTCCVHTETRVLMSIAQTGERNGNYGNNWTDEQKERMSKIAISRHETGDFYTDEWKKKLSISSSEMWKDEEKKKRMAQKVKLSKQKFNFDQYTRDREFIRRWDSVEQIISENPGWKWQNIYAACSKYKPTYHNFVWEKVPK